MTLTNTIHGIDPNNIPAIDLIGIKIDGSGVRTEKIMRFQTQTVGWWYDVKAFYDVSEKNIRSMIAAGWTFSAYVFSAYTLS